MNKIIFCMILLLFCGIAVNAAKVALIPTAPELAPLADQVLAAMSNEPGIEFLERANIEAVLKERQLTASGLTSSNLSELGKLIHADLFAVITAKPGKKGVSVSGLIVYDARNGFRLVNATLPEEDTVKEITKYLRQAQDIIRHPEKQILLSVATVRDAGVPERFKYQQAHIAADLERRLGGIPNVTVLERDYLDSVNKEREITEQMFKLAPSSRLLRLEFAPGSSSEIVNLTLRVTDVANKELFRFNLDNCLSDTEGTAMKTIAAIADYLKVSPPNITVSALDEAARFFAEYQFFSRLGAYAVARRKLNAAIALEPKKLEYRLGVLELNRLRPSRYLFRELTDMLVLNLRLANEIKLAFPEAKPYIEGDILNEMYNRINEATPEQMTILSQWGDEYRPYYQQEVQQLYYKFDLADGINSYVELQSYHSYCMLISRYCVYFNNEKWCDNLYKTALENLRLSQEFLLKHPELCSSSDKYLASDWMYHLIATSGMVYGNTKGRIDLKTPTEKMILNSREYVQLALQHPLVQTRLDALQLELWRKTIESHYDEGELKHNVLEYCRQASAIDVEAFRRSADWNLSLPPFAPNDQKLISLARDIKREYIRNNILQSPMETLFAAVKQSKERAKEVQEMAPQLLQYKALALTVPAVRDFFYLDIAAVLCDKHTPESKAAIAAINCEVEIARLYSLPERRDGHTQTLIRNVIWTNDYIYLLFNHEETNNDFWSISRLEMNTGITTPIISEPTAAKFEPSLFRLQPFAISGKIAIAAGDDCILVFPIDGGKVTEIRDLPGKKVMAATILGDRIYVFAGEEEKVNNAEARETILFSCDFKGSDRRIHISTSSEEKKNIFDREKPFKVHNMIADENKKRLIFVGSRLSGGQTGGLWEFIPSTGMGRCLISDSGMFINPLITVVNDSVFFSFFSYSHYVYDMAADKIELLFSIINPAAKYYLKCQSDSNSRRGAIGYWGPIFARSGQIWLVGDAEVKLLTLPDMTKSPLILMPQGRIGGLWARLAFPHPDGKSAIVIDERNIYKITPKETGVEPQ